MTMMVISRNYRDRSSELAWLVYAANKGPKTATPVGAILAKNVVFADSSEFERIGGCMIIAMVKETDLQTFPPNMNVPEIENGEKLTYSGGTFYDPKGDFFGRGSTIKNLRLTSDGKMTFNQNGDSKKAEPETKVSKANAGSSRAEKARAMYDLFVSAHRTDRRTRIQQLADFKRSAKVSWKILGFSNDEEKKIKSAIENLL